MENLLHKKSSQTLVIEKPKPEPKRTNILSSKYVDQKEVKPNISKKTSRPSVSLNLKLPPHAHLLILACFGYAAIIYILLRVSPATIQNVVIPNSYLPLLIFFFLANVAFFSFLLRNFRRGVVVSCVLTIYVFLRLQQLLTPMLAIEVAVPFVLYEVIASLL